MNIVSAPQVGLSAEEKDELYDSFIILFSGIHKQDSTFIGSNMNDHVGRNADGYGGVHGGMGFGTRNAECKSIIEFSDTMGMVVCNTLYNKEDSKLITHQTGYNRSIIDYLIGRKTDCCEGDFKCRVCPTSRNG